MLLFLKKRIAIPALLRAREGVTLLLVVVLLTVLLSVSLEIFNLIYGETLISGELSDSFVAMYAADQAIERTEYLDRDDTELAKGNSDGPIAVGNNSCFIFTIDKKIVGDDVENCDGITDATLTTRIDAWGEYQCNTGRVVRRTFCVTY